jgi:hypothetical protein
VNIKAISFRQQSFIFSRGSLSLVELEPRDDRVDRCRFIFFFFLSRFVDGFQSISHT